MTTHETQQLNIHAIGISSSKESTSQVVLDRADLRRRCDEIHALVSSFGEGAPGNAVIDRVERAHMRAVSEASGALAKLAYGSSFELGIYASLIATFANLVLDAGDAEHDIPALEAITVRLLNDFREAAGLAPRTAGDVENLRLQIALDEPVAA